MSTRVHKPARPAWTCLACREPWPCLGAREELRKRFGRDSVTLSIHMVMLLHAAATDIYLRANGLGVDPTELHVRFIAWTR